MTEKFRYWACILYPDEVNFPKDYLDILDSFHCDLILSPLHSPDQNPRSDEKGFEAHKKRHYHLVICWNGPTTQRMIESLLEKLGPCVTKPFPVYQVNGYIRYLIHADNPEKEQFENGKEELTCFGRSAEQVEEAFEIGDYDKVKLTKDINNFIFDKYVVEFADLLYYAYNNEPKWAYLLDKQVPKSTQELIRSLRYGKRN